MARAKVEGSGPSAPSKPKPKKANGYKFPEKLPVGEVLKDIFKKEWILGPSIGQGGFGEIYCASDYTNGKFDGSYPYVIKIEPHENGPLFMEKNFYIKVVKSEDVETWKSKEKIKILGIPKFYGSGSHSFKSEKYRFIVIERCDKDLWSIFLSKNKVFPPATVYRCALQIIDILHYIHSKEYIHGDIKGANLLLGLKKGMENNVFLVDFGLACKYSTKEFKKDPKQAHNGTIEYTSCDWHLGIPTRRGDMEILGYNLLHWLSSSLPWEKDIQNKEKVHEKKQQLMSDVKGYFKKNFPDIPSVIVKFMDYVSKLKYDESPDYSFCSNLFVCELKKLSAPVNGKLEFGISATPQKKTPKKRASKRKTPIKNYSSDDNTDTEEKISKKVKSTKKTYNLSNSCSEEEEETKENVDKEEIPPQKNTKTRSSRQRIPVVRSPKKVSNFDSDDEIIENTPTPPVKRQVKKVKPVAKTNVTNKISWRDAPTVAGNINNKAGEYVKKINGIIPKKRAAK